MWVGIPNMPRDLEDITRICQLNIDGIARSKCPFLSKLPKDNNIEQVFIKEIHLQDETHHRDGAKITSFEIIGINI